MNIIIISSSRNPKSLSERLANLCKQILVELNISCELVVLPSCDMGSLAGDIVIKGTMYDILHENILKSDG